jgi:dihydrofolate reductase
VTLHEGRRVGLLVAMSPERVIGLRGTIPWRHPGDQRRFKRLTVGTTVVMGRKTWESLPRRPLPDRENRVLTRALLPGVACFPDLASALEGTRGDVWVIGGARAYAEAMAVADVIDVTCVPDHVTDPEAVRFPPIDPELFEEGALVAHEDAPGLARREYRRRG